MNKSELAVKLAKKVGLTQAKSAEVVDVIFNANKGIVAVELDAGRKVTIPGFGKLIIDAVFNRDYLVVQGVVLVTATTYVVLNLLADLAYFAVNPRLRN